MNLTNLLGRHTGEGRYPDDYNFPCMRNNIMVLSALRSILYNWIPAFAGMTALLHKGYLR